MSAAGASRPAAAGAGSAAHDDSSRIERASSDTSRLEVDDDDAVIISPSPTGFSRRRGGHGHYGGSEQHGGDEAGGEDTSVSATQADTHLPDASAAPLAPPDMSSAPLDVKPAALQDQLHPLPSPPLMFADPEEIIDTAGDVAPSTPMTRKDLSRSPRFAIEPHGHHSRRRPDRLSTPQSGAGGGPGSGKAAYPPGYASSPHSPVPHTAGYRGDTPHTPHTPILTLGRAAMPDEPEFAELLTPAQLRRRRRPRAELSPDAPAAMGAFAGRPLLAGPSRLGWTTAEGDLYRGAAADPSAVAPAPEGDHDDAITIASTSSGSSLWSWGSGGFPAAAGAVVRRLGDAIHRRRGSSSSTSDSSSTHSSSTANSDTAASRIAGRLGRALTRTTSRATAASTEERPKRVHVPRRREFTLVLPSEDVIWPSSGTSTPVVSMDDALPPLDGVTPAPPAQVITTPVLPPLLEAIRAARARIGIANPQLEGAPARTKNKAGGPDVPVRRGQSAPGRPRGAQRTFTAPPVPRPGAQLPQMPPPSRQLSRVEMLRNGAGVPVRPKSASDLLGLTGPRSTSDVNIRAHSEAHSGDDYSMPTEPTLPSPTMSDMTIVVPQVRKAPAAWWLDVSCPTWKDLRDIGELLGLHPLTLEDVLHQDPREKLDIYDKLGYYFVVVRALDEQYFKYTPGSSTSLPGAPPGSELSGSGLASGEPIGVKKERTRRGWGFGRATGRVANKTGEKVEIVEDNPGHEGLEGVGVGGNNLYLVVFVDGIVSFHYDDVSKHTNRVRDRLLTAQRHEPTADWIAHGLLDSIVDAFFPLTGYVDGAVDDIDSLTIDPSHDPRKDEIVSEIQTSVSDEPYGTRESGGEWIELEQRGRVRRRPARSKPKHVSALRRTVNHALRHRSLNAVTANTPIRVALLYLKLFFLPLTSARQLHHVVGGDVYDKSTMLRSITNMRRLVTGLTRLLGGKNMVVASLLKRAADNVRMGYTSSDHEAYLSDVHDHILLLQTSLYHYEYILSHCQPAYLSYLSSSHSYIKGRTSRLILALSTISIGILPMQFVLGLFSMNVNVPANGGHDTDPKPGGGLYPFNWFGGIVCFIFTVACGVLTVVRYWRWVARQKWTTLRGGDLPSAWEGYWGWK